MSTTGYSRAFFSTSKNQAITQPGGMTEHYDVTVSAWGPGPLREAAVAAGARYVPLYDVRRPIHPRDAAGLVDHESIGDAWEKTSGQVSIVALLLEQLRPEPV